MASDIVKGTSIDWKQFFALLGLMIVVWLLWDTWAVYPLKVLVVFFHELSHAIAAWLTGGRVKIIELDSAQGGLCVTEGGIRFVVLTAGYLGSLVWGGILLNLAVHTRREKGSVMLLGLFLAIVTGWLVRPVLHFGFAFGMLTGTVLVIAGKRLPRGPNSVLLKVIGLTSCLYALLDIKSDILDRPGLRSDAYMLGELTGIPTMVWGVLWLGAALAMSLWFLRAACRRS